MSKIQPLKKCPTLLYACSGCSNVGELTDRVTRRLAREGFGEMSCLAGIGGRVKHLVARAQLAERIVVIDGCPIHCARHTLKLAGVRSFEHVSLHELGFRKVSCLADDATVTHAAELLRERLNSDFSP